MATVNDLRDELNDRGIEIPPGAKKADLVGLLTDETQVDGTSPRPRPVWEGGETRREFQLRLQQWKDSR